MQSLICHRQLSPHNHHPSHLILNLKMSLSPPNLLVEGLESQRQNLSGKRQIKSGTASIQPGGIAASAKISFQARLSSTTTQWRTTNTLFCVLIGLAKRHSHQKLHWISTCDFTKTPDLCFQFVQRKIIISIN